MMAFYEKLKKSWNNNNSLLCVGLDSDIRKLPTFLAKKKFPQFTFNKAIIDATADIVCAFKPNSAFYEARGAEGVVELKMTCDYIRENYPNITIIIDAKRADIGSTNEGYVQFVFDYLGADAVTLHPYLGREALQPFLSRKEKGSIILCRTSNPGAGDYQDLQVRGKPIYQLIAKDVDNNWNTNNNCGLVVGATYPRELEIVRRLVHEMPILIPGIGAQGGDLEQSVRFGTDAHGYGAIVNAARSVIFASSGKNFAEAARREALQLYTHINMYR